MSFEEFRDQCKYVMFCYDPKVSEDVQICGYHRGPCDIGNCLRFGTFISELSMNKATIKIDTDVMGENPVHKLTTKIVTEIVEHQDNIIQHKIQEIGGESYNHITIDKNKVIDMLEKYTPKPVNKVCFMDEMKVFLCPNCKDLLPNGRNTNYCSKCGQALLWREE